ncbi:hypothetical protein EOD39_9399 [Acipenser ruthenus]|uniref:Uncharacterized protein n=1 Tax=Acipenser ruthenus TaxID=7906 RepID=A0A444U0P6_ACIRT|nr:hypothetical protein EOD39_9399 [Acipenser ruthenus]
MYSSQMSNSGMRSTGIQQGCEDTQIFSVTPFKTFEVVRPSPCSPPSALPCTRGTGTASDPSGLSNSSAGIQLLHPSTSDARPGTPDPTGLLLDCDPDAAADVPGSAVTNSGLPGYLWEWGRGFQTGELVWVYGPKRCPKLDNIWMGLCPVLLETGFSLV